MADPRAAKAAEALEGAKAVLHKAAAELEGRLAKAGGAPVNFDALRERIANLKPPEAERLMGSRDLLESAKRSVGAMAIETSGFVENGGLRRGVFSLNGGELGKQYEELDKGIKKIGEALKRGDITPEQRTVLGNSFSENINKMEVLIREGISRDAHLLPQVEPDLTARHLTEKYVASHEQKYGKVHGADVGGDRTPAAGAGHGATKPASVGGKVLQAAGRVFGIAGTAVVGAGTAIGSFLQTGDAQAAIIDGLETTGPGRMISTAHEGRYAEAAMNGVEMVPIVGSFIAQAARSPLRGAGFDVDRGLIGDGPAQRTPSAVMVAERHAVIGAKIPREGLEQMPAGLRAVAEANLQRDALMERVEGLDPKSAAYTGALGELAAANMQFSHAIRAHLRESGQDMAGMFEAFAAHKPELALTDTIRQQVAQAVQGQPAQQAAMAGANGELPPAPSAASAGRSTEAAAQI